MISIFSVHAVVGVVDPQFKTEDIADAVDMIIYEYGIPAGPGIAALTPRPEPSNEEEETLQAIHPGTHEVNIIFDFDPNAEEFLLLLEKDSMIARYNFAIQICSSICFTALQEINCVPTYFDIKLSGDYVEDSLYEKIKKHRFKRQGE